MSSLNDLISSSEDKNICTENSKILESCIRLTKIYLNRSNIKTSLMTIPYNASSSTLVDYIIKTLDYSHGENVVVVNKEGETVNRYIGWYKSKDGNLVNYDDINRLVIFMNEVLYVNYSKIKLLTKYLVDICGILNNLYLPVI